MNAIGAIGIPGTSLGIPFASFGIPGTSFGKTGTSFGIPFASLGIPFALLGIPFALLLPIASLWFKIFFAKLKGSDPFSLVPGIHKKKQMKKSLFNYN